MRLGERLELSQDTGSLKRAFSSLIDAMKFARQEEQLRARVEEIQSDEKRHEEALDKLASDLSNLILASREVIGQENAQNLSKQISAFSSLAIQQVKGRVTERFATEHRETISLKDSEGTKTFKSIEAFLVSSPFPILDKVFSFKFVDGAYDARCIHRCVEGIKYEFSLDTKRSELFNREFKLSFFEKEIKIPIAIGKSWHKKDPVPNYDRLDQYSLSTVEATEGNLIANFLHPEKQSSVRVIYSRVNSYSSLVVEYFEPGRKVSVTTEPSLNKFLNSESLEKCMERLWLGIVHLEDRKVNLTELTQGSQNALLQENYLDFFATSWKVIAPRLIEALNKSKGRREKLITKSDRSDFSSSSSTSSSPSSAGETIQEEEFDLEIGSEREEIDEGFVREKIALLGESGRSLLQILNLV